MPLWGSKDQANNAPKWKQGTISKDKVYAQTTAVTSGTVTFTQGSNNITGITSTAGVVNNMRISSNTAAVKAGLTSGAVVANVINSTAVVMTSAYTGTTLSGSANVTFQQNYVTGYNLYQNTTPDAFQNGVVTGVFSLGDIPSYVVTTANTIAGNNFLTNPPTGGFANTQTGAVTQASALLTGLTSTANIVVGHAIYSAAANTTGGSPVWANNVSVANVINSTAVYLSAPSTLTNASAAFYFSNIMPGFVVAGNGIGTINGVNTAVAVFSGTISNGTIGQTGNTLNITTYTSGAPLVIGQQLKANATIGISNGVYITSFGTGTGQTGTYGVSANLVANGAAGAVVVINTIVPTVVSTNATVVILSSNAYATGSYVGNSVTFSSYEKSTFGRSLSSGWELVKYGTGPVNAFTVNTTATSAYANGETIIISGGSANALGTVTTNGTSNVTSVAVTYGGYGFTNVGTTTTTYSRQLHLANVTATGTPSGYVIGDKVTVTCSFALASFTGAVTGNILTASSVTGTITVGNLITGTGVAANTQILAQLTGTAGGAGTYAVGGNQTVASASMTSTGQIVAAVANLTSASVANSVITLTNVGLFTSGLTTANLVFTYANSTGGSGTGTGITFTGSFASASSGNAVNPTLGGKSGRIYTETLVALGPSTENGNDNTTFPNS